MTELAAAIPKIGGHETLVMVHNDAVVQGLCEAPFMGEIEHWGVMTIGTGLGNARFTNRAAKRAPSSRSVRRVHQTSLGQRS